MRKSELYNYLVESSKRIRVYDSILSESERTFRELNSRNMQATLIQIEDFFDSNNLYAFNNWFEGLVWDGPNVDRYWIELTLQYPFELMPEPRAMLRFGEMGVTYDFEQTTVKVPIKVKNPNDLDPMTRKPKEEEKKRWLVTLRIPRHLIEDPMPDETQEVDTVQNIEASKEEGIESTESDAEEGVESGLEVEEGGGDDLEL